VTIPAYLYLYRLSEDHQKKRAFDLPFYYAETSKKMKPTHSCGEGDHLRLGMYAHVIEPKKDP
jgi:hypothetical protein